jgi:AraC-like DNA-binding protein
MRYREYRPGAALAPYVRCIWTMDREYASGGETIWPEARAEILFHYGARYRDIPRAFILGPQSVPVALHARGRLRLIGARLFPWALPLLFRVPAGELLDRVVEASTVAREAPRLEEQLADATDEEAVDLLHRFLGERVARAASDPLLPVVHGVVARPAAFDVDRLARDARLSHRQLERRFIDATGLPPKRVAVIARFNAVRKFLLRHPFAKLSDVAALFGYFDYPHLSRDFRRFLGYAPAELQRAAGGPRGDVVFVQDDGD